MFAGAAICAVVAGVLGAGGCSARAGTRAVEAGRLLRSAGTSRAGRASRAVPAAPGSSTPRRARPAPVGLHVPPTIDRAHVAVERVAGPQSTRVSGRRSPRPAPCLVVLLLGVEALRHGLVVLRPQRRAHRQHRRPPSPSARAANPAGARQAAHPHPSTRRGVETVTEPGGAGTRRSTSPRVLAVAALVPVRRQPSSTAATASLAPRRREVGADGELVEP